MTQTKYDKAVSVCFSGHRNIPFLYRKQLKLQLKAAITKAYAGGYRHFYCGCAMGFDMLAAEVALALQSELSGLQVIAVVPYRGQSERWNDAMKARYDTILCNSDDVIILSEHTTTMAVCFDATTIWFFTVRLLLPGMTETPRVVRFILIVRLQRMD